MAAEDQLVRAMAGGQETEVADALETRRHGVLQETPDALFGGNRHHLLGLLFVPVVFPGQRRLGRLPRSTGELRSPKPPKSRLRSKLPALRGVAHRARREHRQLPEHLLGAGLALRLRQRQMNFDQAAHLGEIRRVRTPGQLIE